jgi:hypothetical protein
MMYKAGKRDILKCLLNCLLQVCKGTLGSYFVIIDTEHRYISQTTTMARPQFWGEEDDLQIWRVAANLIKRQSLPLQNGQYSNLRFGQRSKNLTVEELAFYAILRRDSGLRTTGGHV